MDRHYRCTGSRDHRADWSLVGTVSLLRPQGLRLDGVGRLHGIVSRPIGLVSVKRGVGTFWTTLTTSLQN